MAEFSLTLGCFPRVKVQYPPNLLASQTLQIPQTSETTSFHTDKIAVVVKNPSDFVGSVLGESEKLTKGILASTAGKVLVIDEAYGLYGNNGSNADPYKTSVIDTIVAEVQGVPGDDRCVLLLGYKDQMETMFQNVNKGLSRRFPISSAFEFHDFDDDELQKILELKLKQQGFTATDQAKGVVRELLDRARNRPNFGNAGEIDIILNEAKLRHQRRLLRKETSIAQTLDARDFDENFDRAERADTNVAMLFADTVGNEKVVSLLQEYQENVRAMKELGIDPKETISFNFLFKGPPGTGKTTTARKMGKVCTLRLPDFCCVSKTRLPMTNLLEHSLRYGLPLHR